MAYRASFLIVVEMCERMKVVTAPPSPTSPSHHSEWDQRVRSGRLRTLSVRSLGHILLGVGKEHSFADWSRHLNNLLPKAACTLAEKEEAKIVDLVNVAFLRIGVLVW